MRRVRVLEYRNALRSPCVVANPSVVCDVVAPYPEGCTFRQLCRIIEQINNNSIIQRISAIKCLFLYFGSIALVPLKKVKKYVVEFDPYHPEIYQLFLVRKMPLLKVMKIYP